MFTWGHPFQLLGDEGLWTAIVPFVPSAQKTENVTSREAVCTALTHSREAGDGGRRGMGVQRGSATSHWMGCDLQTVSFLFSSDCWEEKCRLGCVKHTV